MPKCGVCGWSFGGWAMTKHAETPCGEESEKAKPHGSPEFDDLASQLQSRGARFAPEVDDLIKQLEEEEGNE